MDLKKDSKKNNMPKDENESSSSSFDISSQSSVSSSFSSSSVSSLSSSSISSSSSSISSQSSVSSSSFSSSSASSSTEHYLSSPYNLTFVATPTTRTITIKWEWDNAGHTITSPTGFVIERSINGKDWEVLSYDILPEQRSYNDILSETNASLIFAYGIPLSYRIRAYYTE